MEGAGRDKVILGSGTRQRHVRTRGSRARDHTEQILASRMSHFHSTVSSSCRCHRSTESLYTRFFHDPVRRPSSFSSSSLPRPRQPKGTDHDLVFATPIRAASYYLLFDSLENHWSTDFHLRDIFSLSLFFHQLVALLRAPFPLPRARLPIPSSFATNQNSYRLLPRSSSSLDIS